MNVRVLSDLDPGEVCTVNDGAAMQDVEVMVCQFSGGPHGMAGTPGETRYPVVTTSTGRLCFLAPSTPVLTDF